jgi:hypothetical protein
VKFSFEVGNGFQVRSCESTSELSRFELQRSTRKKPAVSDPSIRKGARTTESRLDSDQVILLLNYPTVPLRTNARLRIVSVCSHGSTLCNEFGGPASTGESEISERSIETMSRS